MADGDAPRPDDPHPAPVEPPRNAVRELPRGCNPLTFGVVMATLEMALFVGLWLRCR